MFNPLMITKLLSSQNPMQALLQNYGNNPDLQRAIQMAQGKSPEEVKQIITNLAQQRGINPDTIIDNLNKLGIRL